MKKKILLVSDVKNWGGWVRGQYMRRHLSDEFYFDLMDGEEFEEYAVKTDADVFDQKSIEKFKQISHDKEVFNIKEFEAFCKSKKKEHSYDLIYLLFHTMLLRKSVKRLLDKRKIITMVTAYPTLRAGFVQETYEKSVESFLERANKCVAILANNHISLNDLKQIYKGKTFYASRGVDTGVFYPTKKFTQKPENEFTVAFCGKLNPEKGFDEIVKPACQQAGVKLIANQRNYTDALSPNQMREFYNKADAYIVASTMDGTPNTALEAAACGVTIVANRIGNMPELIKDSVSGFLVKKRKVNFYVHRLKWMKKNQKIAWEIGQRGRQEVLNNWTWNKVLNKNERIIFRELLK